MIEMWKVLQDQRIMFFQIPYLGTMFVTRAMVPIEMQLVAHLDACMLFGEQ